MEDNPLEKERREKGLYVFLVFMCTRADTCINKHFPPQP